MSDKDDKNKPPKKKKKKIKYVCVVKNEQTITEGSVGLIVRDQ